LFSSRNFDEDNERLLIEKVNPTLYNVLRKSLEVKVNNMDKTVVPICVEIRKETVYSYIPEEKMIEGILLQKFDSLILTGKKFNFVYAPSFDKYRGNLSKQTLRCAKVKIEDTEKILLYTSETEVLEWLSKNASKNPQLIDKQIKEELRKKLMLLNRLLD
jgi:hypothetical protein